MIVERKIRKEFEECAISFIEVISQHLATGTDEFAENRIAGISAQIRTEPFLNRSLQGYL
jgi:hypothetical protein